MSNYTSTNEVWVGEKRVMKERLVLEDSDSGLTVKDRLAPYHVYATILILGPKMLTLLAHLDKVSDKTRQFQASKPAELIWSFSPIPILNSRGGVLRVAGVEVEDVRIWLRDILDKGGIRELVGDGLWPRLI